jgi:hypothetical protein
MALPAEESDFKNRLRPDRQSQRAVRVFNSLPTLKSPLQIDRGALSMGIQVKV